MSGRYEAARYHRRASEEAFGVVDHETFTWVKGDDGKAMKFATYEEAQAWIDPRQKYINESAMFRG